MLRCSLDIPVSLTLIWYAAADRRKPESSSGSLLVEDLPARRWLPQAATGRSLVEGPSPSTRNGSRSAISRVVKTRRFHARRCSGLIGRRTCMMCSSPTATVHSRARPWPTSEAGSTKPCRDAGHAAGSVAVDMTRWLLIERLLDAGLTVLAIHLEHGRRGPTEVPGLAGGKSDRFDVSCCARARPHRPSPLPGALLPDTDQTKALRALTRGREVLVEQRVALQPAPCRA